MGWVDETGGGHGVVRAILVDLVCFESANCTMKHHFNVSFLLSEGFFPCRMPSFGHLGNFHGFFLLRYCGSNSRPRGTREDYHWQSHQRLAFGRTDDLCSELLFAGFILVPQFIRIYDPNSCR